MAELIHFQSDGSIGHLIIDSPDNLNAFGTALLDRALEVLRQAQADERVRVIVCSARGRLFSSGFDLKEESASPTPLISLVEEVLASAKPVIASVGGDAYGGALALLGACDIVIAADDARFAMPEVRWGIAPTIAAVLCVPLLRPASALEMMLTGETFDAAWARDAGLITRVVPADLLEETVDGVARSVVLGGPGALQLCKELCQKIPAMTRAEAYELAADISRRMWRSPEGREGMAAFSEKRPPSWRSP